jgi:hypothetical protein
MGQKGAEMTVLTKLRQTKSYEVPSVLDDPRVQSEQAKLSQLWRRRDEAIKTLERAITPVERIANQAKALVDGEYFVSPNREELAREVQVARQAVRIQEERFKETKARVAREAREKLTPQRARLLEKVYTAMTELVDAIEAFHRFLDECEANDVVRPQNLTGDPWIPCSIGPSGSKDLVRNLKAWIDEFKRNAFVKEENR